MATTVFSKPLSDQIKTMFIEQNITFPNMNAYGSTTISVSDWAYAKPFMCQIRENVGARAIIVTNWWLSGTTLYMGIRNMESTSVTGATVPCEFLIKP